jgi:hypothetical protein
VRREGLRFPFAGMEHKVPGWLSVVPNKVQTSRYLRRPPDRTADVAGLHPRPLLQWLWPVVFS